MMMKIHLYLYNYEFTITGEWEPPCVPNIGDSINIFHFLTEQDKKDLEGVLYGDIAEDCSLSSSQKIMEDAYLLPMLYNHACTIEHKTWQIIDGEWVCSFMLKI